MLSCANTLQYGLLFNILRETVIKEYGEHYWKEIWCVCVHVCVGIICTVCVSVCTRYRGVLGCVRLSRNLQDFTKI